MYTNLQSLSKYAEYVYGNNEQKTKNRWFYLTNTQVPIIMFCQNPTNNLTGSESSNFNQFLDFFLIPFLLLY